MELSKIERETIILWNQEEDVVNISTFDEKWIKRIKVLAKKYPDIFVYTPAQTLHYKIFSCYPAEIAAQSDAFTLSFGTKEEYAAYQEQVKGYSLYDTGVDTDADHNMITLMTCNKRGYDYRFLVHAICIEEQGM